MVSWWNDGRARPTQSPRPLHVDSIAGQLNFFFGGSKLQEPKAEPTSPSEPETWKWQVPLSIKAVPGSPGQSQKTSSHL